MSITQPTGRLAAFTATIVLLSTSAAQARTEHHPHHQRGGRMAVAVDHDAFGRPVAVAAKQSATSRSTTLAAAAPAKPFTPIPTTPQRGDGGAIYQQCKGTPASGMRVQRIVVGWNEPVDTLTQCAANATHAGLKLIVSIQYRADWPLAQIQAWFRQALAAYAPYHPYAISVGNEEEIPQEGGENPYAYHVVWNAVEPIIKHTIPTALRVAGEIGPWGLNWFAIAIGNGLTGAQVYAAHPYPEGTMPWDKNPVAFAQLASEHHVQAWATESMCGPGAWTHYGCTRRSLFAHDGFSLAIEWYVS